ncbi:MAG: hypothetical protein QOE70_1607 [Chthoniobacter sp.]|nr:hypothetical protein [Chthoniobacter sp.]
MSFRKGDVVVRADASYPEGALVVDGFDQRGNLLAHPMGGGPQLIVPPSEISKFGIADDLEKTPVFRHALFAIEGIVGDFEGWSDGRHWNGWAMPHFEFSQAERVVAALDPDKGRYDAAADAFITITTDGEKEMWTGEMIALPDGGTAKVYPVGAGSWIWDEGGTPGSDDPQPRSYRSHPEQYRWADRDFRKGDRVVFVGPPDDQYQAAMISPPGEHKLVGKIGTVMMGPSENIRCYPDDPDSDVIWIRFDNDKHPLRQVSRAWLVRECDYRPGGNEEDLP